VLVRARSATGRSAARCNYVRGPSRRMRGCAALPG